MKKRIKQSLAILAFISYAGIALASCNECSIPSRSPCEPCRNCEICPPEPCAPCCTDAVKTGEPCHCAYNAPARIDPACGWDCWATISFIYWQPKEKGLDLGYQLNQDIQNNYSKYKVKNMDFDFASGFKIGKGFSFCRDDWTLYLEYTRLNTDPEKAPTPPLVIKTGSSFQQPTYAVYSIWVEDVLNNYTAVIQSMKAKWKIDYNIFDLELGRPYYLGKKLIFKPRFGLKAGWIDQSYHFKCLAFISPDSTNLYSVYSKNYQDSWLFGPKTGLEADWLMAYNFRLFGNVAGALTYQKFHVKNKQVLPAQFSAVTTSNFFGGKDEISYITPNVDLAIGLGYGSYFFCDRWHFDLAVSYDFNYFWNQNMMRHLTDGQANVGDFDTGNLMLQGLTVTARVDF